MRIGYACQLVAPGDWTIRTCVRKNATPEKLRELIAHNLDVLERMIDCNTRWGIRLFRISSDIVPFGSSPVNGLRWWEEFADKLSHIGEKAIAEGMRLSMHPGQYTVINSPNPDTVENAVLDLVYHTRFLDALGLGREHKIILHIGGAYGDREAAVERFCAEYRKLPAAVKSRLVIENDDRIYNIREVYGIGRREGIPVVFDNLHHAINGCGEAADEAAWIGRCAGTWRPGDGRQKIHYSQQAPGRKPGSHSDTVDAEAFAAFYHSLPADGPDIMLEVKDKNLSAVKCANCTAAHPHIKDLEAEWGRYKYTVLERDPAAYGEIRALLRDKAGYPAQAFYRLLDRALQTQVETGSAVNAAQHVWGYFKKDVTETQRDRFQKSLDRYAQGKLSLAALKRQLWTLAEEYRQPYLAQSLYFVL